VDSAVFIIIVHPPDAGDSRILSNVSQYTYTRLSYITSWKMTATAMTISDHIYKVFITICSFLNKNKCVVGFWKYCNWLVAKCK